MAGVRVEQMFKAEEIADRWSIDKETVYRLWRKGNLKYTQITPGKRGVKRSTLKQIEDYLSECNIRNYQR